ncbi:hypothetical protein GN956_G9780 [Arapaima gigas]
MLNEGRWRAGRSGGSRTRRTKGRIPSSRARAHGPNRLDTWRSPRSRAIATCGCTGPRSTKELCHDGRSQTARS